MSNETPIIQPQTNPQALTSPPHPEYTTEEEYTEIACAHEWNLLDSFYGRTEFYCKHCLAMTSIDRISMEIEARKKKEGL
jgi:hypothetical protein